MIQLPFGSVRKDFDSLIERFIFQNASLVISYFKTLQVRTSSLKSTASGTTYLAVIIVFLLDPLIFELRRKQASI